MDVLYSGAGGGGAILKFCKNFLIDYSIMMRFWTHFIIFTGPAISNPSLQKIVLYLSTSDVMYFVMEKRKTLAKMPFWLFQVENCYFVTRYLLILKKNIQCRYLILVLHVWKIKKIKIYSFCNIEVKDTNLCVSTFLYVLFFIYIIYYTILLLLYFLYVLGIFATKHHCFSTLDILMMKM